MREPEEPHREPECACWLQTGLRLGLTVWIRPRVVHPALDQVVRFEASRHGPNYGWRMLMGALRALHPGWRFPKERVQDVLRAYDPMRVR